MDETLFYLVARTLKRLGLAQDKMPATLHDWQEFLLRINRGFFDFEQERYLLERSMEISSREMLQLNEKFEQAQSTAHLGLWIYDRIDDKTLWSKETYRLFGLNPTIAVPKFEEILAQVHDDDRFNLNQLIERAFSERSGYEAEFRIKNSRDDNFYWMFAKGEAQAPADKAMPCRTLAGIIMDISERKKSEEQLKILQKKLLLTARQAGMSEIATSVLHNIGNVLNSVNVSLILIKEIVDNTSSSHLIQTAKMLNDNLDNLANFLTSDQKGKLIPPYLQVFAEKFNNDTIEMQKEIENLSINIRHIENIVQIQKEISGVYPMNEKILISDVIDSAIKISCAMDNNNINIATVFETERHLTIDKEKLLQILLNLIKNAKEAVLASDKKNKKISIAVRKNEITSLCEIIIQDNGVGIPPENLTKIFSMGYTTKKTGHGFGLHSSALAAIELGGNLHAESEGKDKGAAFILKLPSK